MGENYHGNPHAKTHKTRLYIMLSTISYKGKNKWRDKVKGKWITEKDATHQGKIV